MNCYPNCQIRSHWRIRESAICYICETISITNIVLRKPESVVIPIIYTFSHKIPSWVILRYSKKNLFHLRKCAFFFLSGILSLITFPWLPSHSKKPIVQGLKILSPFLARSNFEFFLLLLL